jgi:two-component sensor histidine kinase
VTILLDGLSGELNPLQHENLAIVLKNVTQLRAMIDDLLEISRIQTGQLVIELQTMSVTDALTYAINTLAGAAALKGITLSSNLDCRLPLVHADPTRIRQVFIALLDNAIKFTPANGSVGVHASVPEENPNVVTLTVSDSGPGIRPEMTEVIFARQFQADPAAESRRGLGLGLYICKELVTRQGGQVWARNSPEKGAVFTVTLPVVSLRSLLAPFLSNDGSHAESLGVISVESGSEPHWPSDDARAQWSLESRALIQKCLLRASDRLVPQTDSGGATEMSFVVAFGTDAGVAVLAKRIKEQLGQLELVQHSGLTISVSYQCLRQVPRDSTAPSETSVRTTAARIAAFISAKNHARYTHQ